MKKQYQLVNKISFTITFGSIHPFLVFRICTYKKISSNRIFYTLVRYLNSHHRTNFLLPHSNPTSRSVPELTAMDLVVYVLPCCLMSGGCMHNWPADPMQPLKYGTLPISISSNLSKGGGQRITFKFPQILNWKGLFFPMFYELIDEIRKNTPLEFSLQLKQEKSWLEYW